MEHSLLLSHDQFKEIPIRKFVRDDEEVLYVAQPHDEESIYKNTACVFGGLACLSMCVFSPCLLGFYPWAIEKIKKQALIVTNKTVYFYQGDAQGCCCLSTGTTTKGLSLEKIQNVDIREPGVGCCQSWINIPSMIIETAGQAGPNARPEIEIKGLIDIIKVKQVILEAADRLKSQNQRQSSQQQQQQQELAQLQFQNKEPIVVQPTVLENNIRICVSCRGLNKFMTVNKNSATIPSMARHIAETFNIPNDFEVEKMALQVVFKDNILIPLESIQDLGNDDLVRASV